MDPNYISYEVSVIRDKEGRDAGFCYLHQIKKRLSFFPPFIFHQPHVPLNKTGGFYIGEMVIKSEAGRMSRLSVKRGNDYYKSCIINQDCLDQWLSSGWLSPADENMILEYNYGLI